MNRKRLFFIVNPVSGSGRGQTTFDGVRAELDARGEGISYGYAISEYSTHALELTDAAVAAGEKLIVAVGGDGTVREVASLLINSDVKMGILPVGTGNDFAKTLGIPQDVMEALNLLLSGEGKLVDAATANGVVFMNVAGFGFDVDVVRYTDKYKKHLNGMLPYLLGIFQSLLHLRGVDVYVEPSEGEAFHTSVLLFSACNGTHFAGGIYLAPLANPHDGLLDVCIVKKISRLRFLNVFPKYMKGKHVGIKQIEYFKAHSIMVDALKGQKLQLDGEIIGETPVRFCVLPNALSIIVPQ